MSGTTRWTQEMVDAQLRKFNNDRAAVQAPDAEPCDPSESHGPHKADKVYTRFHIHIHHRTRRLADATGRCHKAAVDGIVRGGILRDDNPKYLEGISESYEQADVEETIITISPT